MIVLKASGGLLFDQRLELGSQLRLWALSVHSNIAEGVGQGAEASLLHFLSIALGSLHEVETQFGIAAEFEYVLQDSIKAIEKEMESTRRALVGLMKAVRSAALPPPEPQLGGFGAEPEF